ncbi:MAG: hypothetical protein ACKVT0_05065 [Planctomycetaceae bacterium]
MLRGIIWGALVVTIVTDALVSSAMAVSPVPELDPGTASGALTLIVSAGLLLKDKFSRK